MKKFKTIAEFRAYYAEKSLKSYHKKMADPIRAEAYREKRREYEKKRYKKMMDALKKTEAN